MRHPEPHELSKSTLVTAPPGPEPVGFAKATSVLPHSGRSGAEAHRVAILAPGDGDGDGASVLPTRLPSGSAVPLPARALVLVAVLAVSVVGVLALVSAFDDDEGGDRSALTAVVLDGTGTSVVAPSPEPFALPATATTSSDSTTASTQPTTDPSTSNPSTSTSSSTSSSTSISSSLRPSSSGPSSSVTPSSVSTASSPASADGSTTTPTASLSATRSSSQAPPPSGRNGGPTSAPSATAPDRAATTRPTSGSTTGGSLQAPTLPAGTVIWEDGFDRLDASVWQVEHSTYGDGNGELQCYRPDNVSVVGGTLVLRARSEAATCPSGAVRQVTSGMVRSRGVTFSPGQAIEFRVKLTPADPSDQGGLWPAVWASSWAGGSWPVGGELDWLEVMTAEDPTRAMFSLHHADPSGSHRVLNRGVRSSSDFSASWHTVRFDYGRDGVLRWYLDGNPAFSVDGATTLQGWPAPFDAPIREIKINLAVGGRPGPLAPGALGSTGATFAVDYIRIVQL